MSQDYDTYMKELLADLATDMSFEDTCKRLVLKPRRMELSLGDVRRLAQGINTPGGRYTFVKAGLDGFLSSVAGMEDAAVVVVTADGLSVLTDDEGRVLAWNDDGSGCPVDPD